MRRTDDLSWVDDLVSVRLGARAGARARFLEHERTSHGLTDYLARGWCEPGLAAAEDCGLVHHSLRYLEWEARFPGEWVKCWHLKRRLLRCLAGLRLCATHRRLAADLVVLAVERHQRCEDDRYVELARSVVDDRLRSRLDDAGTVRAWFMLYMLNNPQRPPTPHSWRVWSRGA